MPNFTDLAGLASLAILAAAATTLLPGIKRLPKTKLAILQGAAFVLMLIPISGMPLAGYVRGVTGDLSITTLVLIFGVLFNPWCSCFTGNVGSRQRLLVLIALAALVFYPMALGVGVYDPYRLGYGDPIFLSALALLALAAWFWKFPLIAMCISLATLAWSVSWYESGNLWDYLLDPFVSVYALAVLSVRAVGVLLQRGRSHVS